MVAEKTRGPSRAAKVQERKVCFSVGDYVRVDPKRHRRIRVPKLLCYPAD